MENDSIKFCECGCGNPTTYNKKKKDFNSFLNHHYIKTHPISQSESFRHIMCGENNPSKRPEVRAKISKNRKGIMTGDDNHMKLPKYRKMFSDMFKGEKHPMYGKHHSSGTLLKMSISQTGKHHDSEETKKKRSMAKKGIIKSKEHRDKISKTFIEKGISNGSKNPFYGKKHSQETKDKISKLRTEISLKKRFLEGSKKSNYPLRYQIRNSIEYGQWRINVFKRDYFTCQICGEKSGKLRAHHQHKLFSEILYGNNIQSFEQALQCADFWDINNGITLCDKCHKELHKNSKPILRRRK